MSLHPCRYRALPNSYKIFAQLLNRNSVKWFGFLCLGLVVVVGVDVDFPGSPQRKDIWSQLHLCDLRTVYRHLLGCQERHSLRSCGQPNPGSECSWGIKTGPQRGPTWGTLMGNIHHRLKARGWGLMGLDHSYGLRPPSPASARFFYRCGSLINTLHSKPISATASGETNLQQKWCWTFFCLSAFFCHVCVEKDFETTSGEATSMNTFSVERFVTSESHRKSNKGKDWCIWHKT